MTIDLEAIRARCEAATPGPWERDTYYVVGPIVGGRPGGEVIIQCQTTVWKYRDAPWNYANAEFIAHARTDIPALLAEIAGLRKALEEAIVALKGCDGIIADAQMMLSKHLEPEGPSETTTINDLLDLMDGPHQRKVADDTNCVLAQAARAALSAEEKQKK